jgi:hypothetical protein
MTVIAQNISVTYTSTGSTGPYPFTFPISDPTALKVIVNNAVVPPADYTIVPVNNNYDNGGSITLDTAPTAGQAVVLQRSTPLTQASVFAENQPQPMQQFEDALDKLTEIDQELAAAIAAGGGGGGVTQYFSAGAGLVLTGDGTLTNPFVYALSTAFAILSFAGGQSGELGQSFVNPSFTASYSGTPTSANITNTDGVDSPFNLTTPFTSATLAGTLTHATAATVIFTLTATNGVSSPTRTLTFTWQERIFAGVGASGATSSITASGTTAVLSTGDVLPSAGLGVEVVGQTFGPFAPAGQRIYLLLAGGSHTFTDAITGFPLPFNTPVAVTFVNQFGESLNMWFYTSTNPLTGPAFEPKIAS